MRLLLDTHLLLWAMQDSPRLSVRARRFLRDADAVHVSAASLWEIAIKAALGKLSIDSDELEGKLEDKNERINRFDEDINLVIDAARSGIKGKKDELVEGMHVIIGLCTGALQEFPK